MHLEAVGEGTRTLVVLPGWRLDSEVEKAEWLPVLARSPGWRGVFVDTPGVGLARGDLAGVSDQGDVLTGLVQLLDDGAFGAQEIAVAGLSNGGALAIGLARRRPRAVKGLALRVPRMEADDGAREAAGKRDWERSFAALPAPARASHRSKYHALWEPAETRRTDAEFLRSIREDPSRYRVPDEQEPFSFAGPALVVLGRQDPRSGWELAWERLHHLPRATVVLLDRAGHELPVGESQAAVWETLALDWLFRVEESWTTVG